MNKQSNKQQENEADVASSSQEQVTNKNIKKRRSVWRYLWYGLLLVILLLIALLGLLFSGYGQRFLVHSVDKLLDDLSIEQVSGDLQSGLVLEKVNYQTDGVNVQLAETEVKLDFACLWQRTICIDLIALNQPIILLDSTKFSSTPKEKKTQPITRLQLPLAIKVKQIALQQGVFKLDNEQIKLKQFTSAVEIGRNSLLTLAPTLIDTLDITHYNAETTKERTSINKSAPIDWKIIKQRLQKPLLDKAIQITLPLDINIAEIKGENWRYQEYQNAQLVQNIEISALSLQAESNPQQIKLHHFNVVSSLGNINSSGWLNLTNRLATEFKLESEILPIEQEQQVILPKTTALLTLQGELLDKTNLTLNVDGIAALQLEAEAKLSDIATPFKAHLTVAKLHYPYSTAKKKDERLLVADNLDMTLSGNLLDYQLTSTGQIKGRDIPATKFTLYAQGTPSSLQLQPSVIEVLQGEVKLNGQLSWENGLSWQNEILLQNVSTKSYPRLKEWDALLSGAVRNSGEVSQEGWQVGIEEVDLQGKLNQQSLALKGGLKLSNQTLLTTNGLSLLYGSNKIVVTGKLGKDSAFDAEIAAPNLNGLVPHLQADLNGIVHLKGNVFSPTLQAELTSRRISFNELNVQNLFFKGDIKSDQDNIRGRVDFHLDRLSYGDIRLSQAKLWLTGTEKKHQLHLRSQGDPIDATLNLYGNFDRASQIWQGTVSQVNIGTPLKDFKADKNLQVTYQHNEQKVSVSAHCWRNASLPLCFPQDINVGKEGKIPFEIKQANLAELKTLLPEKTKLEGNVNANGMVEWFSDKPLKLDIGVTSSNIAFAQRLDYRTLRLNLNKLDIQTHIADNNLSLQGMLALKDNGRIQTDMNINGLNQARSLAGGLTVDNITLALIRPLLNKGDSADGVLQGELKFAGNLDRPLLNGELVLNELKTGIKALPFDISSGEIALMFNGNHSTLHGKINTAESQLNLQGETSWQSVDKWQTQLKAQADKFKLTLPTIAELTVSPDIEIQATPQLLTATGKVDIPWARIEVEELPESAIAVSSDEVIIRKRSNNNKLPVVNKAGMIINSDININIGDDVRLKAYGLQTNLQGKLNVRQEKNNLGLFGQVNVIDGRYEAFGQDLIIRKGQINFSGLASQPFLNIEAIRNPEAMENEDIVAGVKVTGIADSPELQVFSEPSMSQDNALAYLLTGRSLEGSGDSAAGSSVGAALIGLGLAKSSKLVGGIGETFGISDFNIGTQGVGSQSQVVVSGYVTPRLQVKYGVGLFESLAELTLRYRLLPKLYLQSVTGATQAIDLLYQFEH